MNLPQMATCAQFREAMVDHADRWLDGSLPRELDEHFINCAACRDELRTYRKTIALCRWALMAPTTARRRRMERGFKAATRESPLLPPADTDVVALLKRLNSAINART